METLELFIGLIIHHQKVASWVKKQVCSKENQSLLHHQQQLALHHVLGNHPTVVETTRRHLLLQEECSLGSSLDVMNVT
jgi:hypothetical protein